MNRLTITIMTLVLILLMMPASATAEIYKYRDADGVLRFTDNLAEVPMSQRQKIEQYQEIKTTTGEAEQTTANDLEKEADLDPAAAERELTSEKEVLDNEYAQLMEMRNSIETAPQPSTPEQIAAHEEKIQDYQIQLKIYEVKQKAFREKVQAYQEAARQ